VSAEQPQDDGLARFGAILDELDAYLNSLTGCESHSRDHRPAAPDQPGVYLFTEVGEHRYIGRAKNLNKRFGQHVAPKSSHNQAAFAFNIAKRAAQDIGFPVGGRTRDDLGADPEFNDRFFSPAKARVRAMDFRFVVFDLDTPDVDALSTIFEVYASLRLGTEGAFNLFATH
jgi:hypothetical protein